VTALRILVDLREKRVAEIDTDAKHSVISPVAGKPFPSCNEDQTG
jgi:hypothetical protein